MRRANASRGKGSRILRKGYIRRPNVPILNTGQRGSSDQDGSLLPFVIIAFEQLMRDFPPLLGFITIWLIAGFAVASPMNVILFIGDGMGSEHIKAGRYFANGDTRPLTLESLIYSGLMTHNNASNGTTDSAAAATAMATGQKTNNGVISLSLPGTGGELMTALEVMQADGKRAGLVTVDTPITDATPASFGAHDSSRSNQTDIANDLFNQTRPNVLFGEPGGGINPEFAAAAGYDVVLDQTELFALNTETTDFVSGQFNFGNAGAPTLAEMTTTALNILDDDPDGFFLMVEHEDTDSGAHVNDISRVVNAVVELDQAVDAALTWATTKNVLHDTLVVVTADHETGGLDVITNNGAGNLPGVTWSTTGHTQTPVPVSATGTSADAARVQGTIDNTDIFYILTSSSPPADPVPNFVFQQGMDGYTSTVDTMLQQASPTSNNASATELNVDNDDPSESGNEVHALLRFDDILGDLPGQIPLAAEIESAFLELEVSNAGDSIQLHRMLTSWQDTVTWDSLDSGVQADDVEALAAFDWVTASVNTGVLTMDVTDALRVWQANPTSNHGWVLLPSGSDGVDFSSGEGPAPLTLKVTVPEPSTLALVAVIMVLSICPSGRN